jgi:hypothetical protein
MSCLQESTPSKIPAFAKGSKVTNDKRPQYSPAEALPEFVMASGLEEHSSTMPLNVVMKMPHIYKFAMAVSINYVTLCIQSSPVLIEIIEAYIRHTVET